MAIYIRSVHKQLQFYTSRGKWRIASNKDLDFVFKGFATKEMVAQLHPYLPEKLAVAHTQLQNIAEGGLPREVGAPLLRKLEAFDTQVGKLYRQKVNVLTNIYDHVAEEDERLELTLSEIISKAVGIQPNEITPEWRFVVHRATSRYPFIIDNDRSSVFVDHYLIHPKSVARTIDTVGRWVREHQDHVSQLAKGLPSDATSHPLQKFIDKAQRLIRHSRKLRSPTTMASVGPTSQRYTGDDMTDGQVYRQVPSESFTETDKIIIHYLQYFCIPPRRMTGGILRYAGIYIMRSTKMYSTVNMTSGSVPLLLQEMGVFSPWENIHLLDQSLALPGHGISTRSDEALENARNAASELETNGLNDAMEELRKDWGDLPVYCVDSIDAMEIDDGISLERIPGSVDTFWVHAHIANPSAFIPPQNPVAKYAADVFSTLYAPDRLYPMLPSSLTQPHLSLAPGRATLTISAKVKIDGEVLESKIVNGRIHNVIYTTHKMVRDIVDDRPTLPAKPLVVGGKVPLQTRDGLRETLSAEDKETFRTIQKIMQGVRRRWRENGGLAYAATADLEVSVYSGAKNIEPHVLNVTQGRHFVGDPTISLSGRHWDPYEVPDVTKDNLVATVMNFACSVAGQWCAQRKIPVVYDGTFYHPEYEPVTNENFAEYGGKKWLTLSPPSGIISSSAIPHAGMGVDAYTKVTSPLRRYVDLLAHYQIEAALRYESKHPGKYDGNRSKDSSIIPFSKADVDQFIESTRWLRRRLTQVSQGSQQFWSAMLFFRAFYFNECELPETFPCLLGQPLSMQTLMGSGCERGHTASILPYNVRSHVLLPNGFPEVDFLSTVDAKIIAVDMAREIVILEATKPVKQFERTGDWA
jgi:hypothetical protein